MHVKPIVLQHPFDQPCVGQLEVWQREGRQLKSSLAAAKKRAQPNASLLSLHTSRCWNQSSRIGTSASVRHPVEDGILLHARVFERFGLMRGDFFQCFFNVFPRDSNIPYLGNILYIILGILL